MEHVKYIEEVLPQTSSEDVMKLELLAMETARYYAIHKATMDSRSKINLISLIYFIEGKLSVLDKNYSFDKENLI